MSGTSNNMNSRIRIVERSDGFLICTRYQLPATLRPRGKTAAIPSTADRLDQKYSARHAPTEDVDCREFITQSGVLSRDHFEIARDSAYISSIRKVKRSLRGLDRRCLDSCFLL